MNLRPLAQRWPKGHPGTRSVQGQGSASERSKGPDERQRGRVTRERQRPKSGCRLCRPTAKPASTPLMPFQRPDASDALAVDRRRLSARLRGETGPFIGSIYIAGSAAYACMRCIWMDPFPLVGLGFGVYPIGSVLTPGIRHCSGSCARGPAGVRSMSQTPRQCPWRKPREGACDRADQEGLSGSRQRAWQLPQGGPGRLRPVCHMARLSL